MKFCIPITIIAALSACSTVPVSMDHDETVDFTAYRTFGWWQPTGGDPVVAGRPTTFLDRRVRRAIARVLVAKGVGRSDRPDIRIAHRLRTREMRDVSIWDHGYGFRTWGRGHVSVRGYVEGTLILDVIDVARNALVWQGATRIPLGDTGPSEESVAEAVEAMLARFPPGP